LAHNDDEPNTSVQREKDGGRNPLGRLRAGVRNRSQGYLVKNNNTEESPLQARIVMVPLFNKCFAA
jgi:hypothetical protein